jgi:hypothetical protein
MRDAALYFGLASVFGLLGCGRIGFDLGGTSTADGALAPDGTQDDAGATVTVTFGENASDTYQGVTEDTQILSLIPGSNFGGSVLLGAGVNATLLMRFDVSALPPVTTNVVAARLHLMGDDGSLSNVTMTIHRVREVWTEGTQQNSAGTANWNERTPAANWMAAGAAPPSRDSMPFATFTYQMFSPHVIDLAIADVQEWIDVPATNLGFAITGATVGGQVISSEGTGPRPQLELVLSP